MFKLILLILFIIFVKINGDDGGLSDIPFTGTVEDVQEAYRTKLAVELAEKGKIPIPSKESPLAVFPGIGGIGSQKPRIVESNIANVGPIGGVFSKPFGLNA
uniref:Uncharacterized protein n=1 Tax=Panagrolaimus superbus TaxID=310955 RepID=A0A914Y3E5_9BILA